MEVKCKTKDTLPLLELVEFQGNLKERTDKDYEKIEKSIKKHGFSFPFFVWHHDGINHVLDGHGRIGALKRMVASGETIPELPVVYGMTTGNFWRIVNPNTGTVRIMRLTEKQFCNMRLYQAEEDYQESIVGINDYIML